MQYNLDNYYNILTNREISTAEETFSENEAVDYLLHEFIKRSPTKPLEQYISLKRNNYKKEEFDKLFNPDNIKRWMAGKPISRDKAFELTIYFGLDFAETEIFVRKYCMCDWLYLRSYSDAIYYFFIKNAAPLKLEGREAVTEVRKLIAEFGKVYEEYLISSNDIKENEISKNRFKRLKFESKLNPLIHETEPITERCRKKLDLCTSIDELSGFLTDNIEYFGEFNRKAYKVFMDELELNKQIHYKKTGKKKAISEIADQISIDFDFEKDNQPPTESTQAYAELLKDLQHNNPDRQGIEATISQKKPVTRKQLIMLFLLNECEGERNSGDFEYMEDEIEERRMRINMMLYECGMPLLDAYQSFDWLILNALATIPYEKDIEIAKNLLSSDFFELLLSKIVKGYKNE